MAGTGCNFVNATLEGAEIAGGLVLGGLGAGSYVYDAGTSVVCLGSDAAVDDSETFAFGGEVIAVDAQPESGWDNLVDCWTEPSQVLVVRDENGDMWRVGYAWIEGDWDSTPWVAADRGDWVDVFVRQDTTPGSSAAGFTVHDAEGGLIYALESGVDGQGLQDGDIANLSVVRGADVGTTQGTCGARDNIRIEFTSESDRLALGPGGDAGMTVDGQYVTTCNIDSFTWQDATDCADPGEVSWVMF
jgi:hypothetical protein